MDIHTSRYMYDAPCDIHDAFPMRHTYASYSDAFMTRSVSDAWETRLIPSVEVPGTKSIATFAFAKSEPGSLRGALLNYGTILCILKS